MKVHLVGLTTQFITMHGQYNIKFTQKCWYVGTSLHGGVPHRSCP